MRSAVFVLVVFAAACGDVKGRPVDGGGDGDAIVTCPRQCSADLHDVVDCHGNVVESCADDEGCSPSGTCVPACDAAAASNSSVGCEYYAVAPAIIEDGTGACFAAFVANTWTAPITLTVEREGVSLPLVGFARVPSGQGQTLTYAPLTNGQLQPGEVAILFLARSGTVLKDCPAGITPAYTATNAAVVETGLGQAFRIKSSAPVVAYDIFPYGGGDAAATSATLLLPTSAWHTNYVAVDAFRRSTVVAGAQPVLALVAAEDNTSVTIKPTAAIVGGPGVAPGPQGAPSTYVLARGQVLQFEQDATLAGSAIESDKPIGVWAGASCLSIDVDQFACDSAHQQIPPVRALGHRYAAVRYRNRFPELPEEVVPWRLVGAAEGTTLTYSPAPPPGAPTTLAPGQIAEFETASAFTVESQDANHPFYVSAHMTGCGEFSECRGDPEFVNVIPLDQYLAQYTFFTDPTYPETHLVFTRERRNGTFADVTLGCAGVITGWQPVDATGDVELARVSLVTGNFEGVNGCNNGVHVATSTAPFGLVVWGWGSASSSLFSLAVSYAYPAGADVKKINDVILKAR